MSRSYIPRTLRARVSARARYRCGYCLTAEAIVGTPMEIDHLVPESLGGPTEEDNLWLACSLCNEHKGNRVAAPDPLTGELVRLFDGRHDSWRGHFAWTPEGDRIRGLTATGRTTILALELNRPSLVIARRARVAVGCHPPSDL